MNSWVPSLCLIPASVERLGSVSLGGQVNLPLSLGLGSAGLLAHPCPWAGWDRSARTLLKAASAPGCSNYRCVHLAILEAASRRPRGWCWRKSASLEVGTVTSDGLSLVPVRRHGSLVSAPHFEDMVPWPTVVTTEVGTSTHKSWKHNLAHRKNPGR